MTDQPTPAPWEIAPEGTYPTEEGHKILGPWRKTEAGHDVRYYVAQFMTKADAEFLVRAQHMDELVETMKPRLSKKARAELEQTAEAEENDGSTTLADAIRFLLEQEDRRATILAKIKVAK